MTSDEQETDPVARRIQTVISVIAAVIFFVVLIAFSQYFMTGWTLPTPINDQFCNLAPDSDACARSATP
jgi:hypothetical protein